MPLSSSQGIITLSLERYLVLVAASSTIHLNDYQCVVAIVRFMHYFTNCIGVNPAIFRFFEP